jgi:hypothetical protein
MSESPPLAAHKWPGCIVMGIWSRNWSRSFQASVNHTAAAQTFRRPRFFLECQSGLVFDVVSKVSTTVNQQCLSLHWERTLLCAVGSRRSIMIQKMLMFTQSRSAFNPETICSAEKLNRGSRRMCVRYSSSLCRPSRTAMFSPIRSAQCHQSISSTVLGSLVVSMVKLASLARY